MLVEVLPDGKQVIGIGINTNNTAADAPAEVRSRVATLREPFGSDQRGGVYHGAMSLE